MTWFWSAIIFLGIKMENKLIGSLDLFRYNRLIELHDKWPNFYFSLSLSISFLFIYKKKKIEI